MTLRMSIFLEYFIKIVIVFWFTVFSGLVEYDTSSGTYIC